MTALEGEVSMVCSYEGGPGGDTALHLAASQDHKAVARLEQSADI